MADTTNGDDKGKEAGGKRKSSYKLPEKATDAKADAGAAEGGEAEVIDLDEARPAAGGEGAGVLDGAVGDALRQSFRRFVVENVLPKDTKQGSVDLNIDANFLRQHGTQLLSSLVEGVAKAILPEAVEMNLPLGKGAAPAAKAKATDSQPAEDAAAPSGDEPDVNVNVNFDAMTFLKSLLAPTAGAGAGSAKADTDDDELED